MHMSVIVPRIVSFLTLVAILFPAMVAGNDDLDGTMAEWNVDDDLDGTVDGRICIDGIDVEFDPENGSIAFFSCTITVMDESGDIDELIPGSNASWNGIALLRDDAPAGEENEYRVAIGVIRKCAIVPVSGNGTASYDLSTGLLVAIHVDGIPRLKLHATDFFFNAGTMKPTLIVAGVITGAFAIVFTMHAAITDRKKRSTRACFDPDCWA